MKIQILIGFALALTIPCTNGCVPKVVKFDHFNLSPGEVDVVWAFVDDRLNRCVNTPKGPVCARVNYVKAEATESDLLSMPPTPPSVGPTPAPAAQHP